MWRWLKKDPVRKLQAEYEHKLREARDLQRNGDIVGYASTTEEAEVLGKQLEAFRERR